MNDIDLEEISQMFHDMKKGDYGSKLKSFANSYWGKDMQREIEDMQEIKSQAKKNTNQNDK